MLKKFLFCLLTVFLVQINIISLLGLAGCSESGDNGLKKEVTIEGDNSDEIIDFAKLKRVNQDIIAWAELDNSDIAFPILQGTDNEFYLTHAYDKQFSSSGSIFLDHSANRHFIERNTFIYGHSIFLSDNKMLSFLKNYMDYGFYERYPSFTFYTEDDTFKVLVFSAYEDIWNSTSYQPNIDTDTTMKDYVEMIKAKSVYKTNIEVSASDNIITFYTCSFSDIDNYSTGQRIDKRYYIHGLIKE